MKSLNQNTLIPIGLAIFVIGGGAAWVTNVSTEMAECREEKVENKKNNAAIFKMVYEINSRLSRLEWKLEKEK